MSTGPFSRTNRTPAHKNLLNKQQPSEVSTLPSQISSGTTEQPPKGGYVYRPPSRIVRTNINQLKQPQHEKVQKVEPKKEELKIETPRVEQLSRTATFAKKIMTQTTAQTHAIQVKEQVKPPVKPVSRLNANRSDPMQLLGFAPPKREQPPKKQQEPKVAIKVPQTKLAQIKKPIIQQKSVIQTKPLIQPKPQVQQEQLSQENTKSMPVLDLKKPAASYTYPKKISRRGPQNEEKPAEERSQTQPEQQTRQETPKFNRTAVEQKAQTPQVSQFSYQRKNVTQPQSSQSAVNLKPAYQQSIIQPPFQKVQPISVKPVSTIMQSPQKSPLSHASRYSSKVTTPAQQQKKEQPQIQKPPVKRSPLISFALHRLYLQKANSYFNQVVQFSKNLKQNKHNEKHHQFVDKAISKFTKVYQKNVMLRGSFNLLKNIFSKLVKTDMAKSLDPKIANVLVQNRNQCIGRIMENILVSDLSLVKAGFNQLKLNVSVTKTAQSRIYNGAKVMGNFETRRLKLWWKILLDWVNIRNQTKSWLISRCSEINTNFKKTLLKDSLSKLSLYKLKQKAVQVKSSTIPKPLVKPQPPTIEPQQQQSSNNQLRQKVQQLQAKLAQIKQQSSEATLRQTVQQLKSQKQQSSQQLSQKKQINSELNDKLEQIKVSSKNNEQQPSWSENNNNLEAQEPTLSLVHQIYMKSYRQSEDQCISQDNVQSLWTIHRVQQNAQEREMVKKWLQTQQNIKLKHWINLYQGNYADQQQGSPAQNSSKQQYRQLEQENDIIKKFIRSYIKERYMWEEVKEYVAAVISQ